MIETHPILADVVTAFVKPLGTLNAFSLNTQSRSERSDVLQVLRKKKISIEGLFVAHSFYKCYHFQNVRLLVVQP